METSGKEEEYIQSKKPKKKERERENWGGYEKDRCIYLHIYILHLYTDYGLQITEGQTE